MSREAFLKRLRRGHELQLEIGKMFLEEGFIVKVHPYQENRADDYDIMVKPSDRANWREIEVKGNGKLFTDVDDFPYKNVFVETVRRRKARKSPPEYYVIVSYKGDGCLCLPSSTEEHWSTFYTKDTQKNIYDEFLQCPKEYCETWDQMVGRLRGIIR